MKKRIGPIRRVLSILFAASAFVAEFMLQTSAIEGLRGQVIGVGVGLFVAVPLAVIVLIIRWCDLGRIGRVIVLTWLGLFFLGLLALCVSASDDFDTNRNDSTIAIFVLLMILGAAVIAYFATSVGGSQSDDTSEE